MNEEEEEEDSEDVDVEEQKPIDEDDYDDEEDDDMEEIVPFQSAIKFNIKESSQTPIKWEANTDTIVTPKAQSRSLEDVSEQAQYKLESYEDHKGYSFQTHRLISESPKPKTETPKPEASTSQPQPKDDNDASSSESGDETWSHSPPFGNPIILEDSAPSTPATPSNPTKTQPTEPESWDAAQEMNAHEEEGEFARFAAQVRGRDVNEVRKEIDEEIRQLNQQRKAAMRDSDEITQEMKPRSRILAEYLAHGYVVGDATIEQAIELDKKHEVSSRFLDTLQNLDKKYHATDRAKATDQTYGISQRANSIFGGLNSYFEQAKDTPTGKRVAKFYLLGSKEVQDIHNEARRLAELKKQEHGGSAYKAAGFERFFGKGKPAAAPESSTTGEKSAPAADTKTG